MMAALHSQARATGLRKAVQKCGRLQRPEAAVRRALIRTFRERPLSKTAYVGHGRIAEVNLPPTEMSKVLKRFVIKISSRFFETPTFAMDKFFLQQQVLQRLAEDLLQAEQAAREAHETATHEENIAENKYDTLGLEAAYLATGQSRRAEAIREAMADWRRFRPRPYDAGKGIELGSLVSLVDSDDQQQQIFLGPAGGSMKLVSGDLLVQVISSEAPLGRAMLGKCEGDEVSIQGAPIRQQFEVLRVL